MTKMWWCHGVYNVYVNGRYKMSSTYARRVHAKNKVDAACDIIEWYAEFNTFDYMYEIVTINVVQIDTSLIQ
ncbi:hypothetical protein UES1_164 [Escherichia phage UE-S1]|nr:hypothetical protein UES1_164 [Escherichia phage UE-S1]